METLAYLHLAEDFENPETKELNSNLSKTAGKAAIGLIGTACTVSVLGATNAAFACNYQSEHYYYPESDSYQYDSYQYDSYQSCGCEGSQQSYYPDYSEEYSYYAPEEYSYYAPEEYSYYSPVDYGYDGQVATLQSVLADLGYYAGPIDGVYGPGTSDAVAQYQIDSGLAVDGVAGEQTLYSLGLV